MNEKSDKAAFFIKTAIRVVLGALIVMVFIRNAFPEVKQAVVLEEVSSGVFSESNSSVNSSTAGNSSASTSSENLAIDRVVPVEPTESVGNAESSSALPEISESNEISSAPEPQVADKININTAPASELVKLAGIGESKAAAIIKYRNENGGFKSIDELVKVSGIGEKTLEHIRDLITV